MWNVWAYGWTRRGWSKEYHRKVSRQWKKFFLLLLERWWRLASRVINTKKAGYFLVLWQAFLVLLENYMDGCTLIRLQEHIKVKILCLNLGISEQMFLWWAMGSLVVEGHYRWPYQENRRGTSPIEIYPESNSDHFCKDPRAYVHRMPKQTILVANAKKIR